MKIIEKQLYLTLREMVEAGYNEGSLLTAKSKGTKCWKFANDPEDLRKVLVCYDTMTKENQQKVESRFGNPYNMIARQPILDMVQQDAKAYDFYKQYRYNETLYLPIEVVNKYTRAASWLNMLSTVQDDRSIIKKDLCLTIPQFYEHVAELINSEKTNGKSSTYTGIYTMPGDFPATYQKLLNKVDLYKKGGYDTLIHRMYGNKLASKIGKIDGGFDPELEGKQMAIIRRIARLHTNLDAAQVAQLANIIFEKNNWETIGEKRVWQIMNQNKAVLTPGRRGKRVFNSEIAMQLKRKAPQFPTYYWTLDGWTVELLYQDEKSYSNRLVMVVVLDAMNKYPVGYAIGDRENAELIRQANRNALIHMKELFGDYYRPYQLQSDNYAIKQLTPFYQAVSHLHTPAAVGNAKSKIIEPYFKYLNKEYCQKFPNWSGHNIDSKKANQVNREMLDLIKHSFPNRDGVVKQIEYLMSVERRNKMEAFIAGFNEMPGEDKNILTDMDWLMVFGQPVGKTNSITGQGVIKMINGRKVTYDCFEPLFRKNLTIDWQIIADLQDISKVLAVSPDGKLRFVLEQKHIVAMDIKSSTEEDYAYESRVDQFNKERRQEIIELYASDTAIVDEVLNNTPLSLDDHSEAALKLMLTYGGQQKEKLQDAKRLKNEQKQEQKKIAAEQKQQTNDWQEVQRNYMTSKIDHNKYLD